MVYKDGLLLRHSVCLPPPSHTDIMATCGTCLRYIDSCYCSSISTSFDYRKSTLDAESTRGSHVYEQIDGNGSDLVSEYANPVVYDTVSGDPPVPPHQDIPERSTSPTCTRFINLEQDELRRPVNKPDGER